VTTPQYLLPAPSADGQMDTSELITPAELAAILKVSKRTVFRMRAKGALPPAYELTTNLIRWRSTDIQEYIRDLRIRKPRGRICTN